MQDRTLGVHVSEKTSLELAREKCVKTLRITCWTIIIAAVGMTLNIIFLIFTITTDQHTLAIIFTVLIAASFVSLFTGIVQRNSTSLVLDQLTT